MSLSVFYAVRFSPAPELGEWLNVAVVGEGITERRAGLVVADSVDRIRTAFGPEAAERVQNICADLKTLVNAMAKAHGRGEETQPIPTAMKDQALSVSFSDQIMVFEGTFDEALAIVAKKYLTEGESAPVNAVKAVGAVPVAATAERHKTQTVVIVGNAGPMRDALGPALVEGGMSVRVLEAPESGAASLGEARKPSILEVAKQAGVTAAAVGHVLFGEGAKSVLSPGTVDRIMEAAGKLGIRVGDHPDIKVVADREACLEGADAVVFIAEVSGDDAGTARVGSESHLLAQEAKSRGLSRFVFVSACRMYGQAKPRDVLTSPGGVELSKSLGQLQDASFAVTVLSVGEIPDGAGLAKVVSAARGEAPVETAAQEDDAIQWGNLAGLAKPVDEGATGRTIKKKA